MSSSGATHVSFSSLFASQQHLTADVFAGMTTYSRRQTWLEQSSVEQDFAGIWQSADRIVYSRTLETVTSARTRIERDFDPGERIGRVFARP